MIVTGSGIYPFMLWPKATVDVTVTVPPHIEAVARERAFQANDPERFEDYLLDHLLFEYEFETSDDVAMPSASPSGV